MRIISKIHDYYDAALSQGREDDRVYVRHEQVFENAFLSARGPQGPTSPLPAALAWTHGIAELAPSGRHFVFKGQGYEVSAGWVLFAGRLYPYARLRTLNTTSFFNTLASGVCANETFVYDFASLQEWAQARDECFEPKKTKYRAWRVSSALSWPAFFELRGSERWHALATEHRVPILDWGRLHGAVRVHGALKPLQFFRCMDAWQAYQELSMFVGNLSLPHGPLTEISDQHRLEQHGFDEWSFRKPSVQANRAPSR